MPFEEARKMLEEFKKFIMRGNVVDMAVGIIVGAAFATVVQSLVDDIIMPPIGSLLGGVDFSNLFITLGPGSYESLAAAQEAGAATINYGLFISNVITFLIVGLVVFLLIKAVNQLDREEEAPGEPTTKNCPECLSEIPIGARRCAFCTTSLESNEEG
jgi:large conductance mechanosensitive channel